jgi:hypothetical protein
VLVAEDVDAAVGRICRDLQPLDECRHGPRSTMKCKKRSPRAFGRNERRASGMLQKFR